MRVLTALAAVWLVSAATAEAQVVFPAGGPVTTEAVVGSPYGGSMGVLGTASAWGGYIPPYSYYAAPFGYPPRIYSGYGYNDFPFYGRPYGRPYDPWSWPYLSGNSLLARYYYPPL